jgi:hypothetical protein
MKFSVDNFSDTAFATFTLEPMRKKQGERDYTKAKPKGKDSWKEQRRKEERNKNKEVNCEP